MEDHTADNIGSNVLALMEDWHLDPKKAVAAVTDSASNNVKAFRDLGIPRISCFGHNLDLAVHKIDQIDGVVRAVKACKKTIEVFSRS